MFHDKSWKVHSFSYHTGHYDVSEESIILSSNNLSSGDKNHVWTFRANTNQRINFHFPKYFFSFNVYEIGDGMNKSSPTRLARFKGIDYPSNVTSVSNCAWFSVDVLYLHRFSPTHLFHIPGQLFSICINKYLKNIPYVKEWKKLCCPTCLNHRAMILMHI